MYPITTPDSRHQWRTWLTSAPMSKPWLSLPCIEQHNLFKPGDTALATEPMQPCPGSGRQSEFE